MQYPLQGDYPITQGWNNFSYMYPYWGFRHKGIDWGAPKGTPIYPVDDGMVIESGHYAGWGNKITIEHGNGFISIYGHLNERNCIAGDSVYREDVIGTVDSTGISTGHHLHLSIKLNGRYVNPLLHLQKEDILKEINMTYEELVERLKTDLVGRDVRFNFDQTDGSIWIVNNSKRYKLGTKSDDINVLGAKMCKENLSDVERTYPITKNRKEVL